MINKKPKPKTQPNRSVQKVKNQNQKRVVKTKTKTSLNNTTTLLALLTVIIGIVCIKFLGIFFTIFLIVGIGLILFFSKLINKMSRKKRARKIINALVIIFLILCIAGCIGVGGFFLYVVKESPEFDVKNLTYSESTLLYDINNKLVAELGTNKRENIEYEEMSEVLIDAIVATEDSRFFQHNGFDAARFFKAGIGQVFGNSDAGGASTLSMQVIKNSFTSSEASGFKGIVRKFTDIYLSVFKLEKNYTKQEIIEFYANNHFLGANAYGVEQASKTYFGKHASELTLAEASLIVGIFKAPTSYNPFNNPEAATERRETVLNLMYRHGYITKEQRDLANSIPVENLLIEKDDDSSEFQGYIDTIVEEVQKKWKVNPYNTPLIIYSNMDSKKQSAINKIFTGESFKWENSYIQAGVAVVESNSGKILAVGNGRNRSKLSYNLATSINRQIGSTSKPIIDYAPGMEYLNWSTYTIFDDEPYQYSSGQPIRNSDRTYMGEISIRQALQHSRNVPALKAFQEVTAAIGNKKHQQFVKGFGLQTEDYFHEAHSIGSFNGSNPLTMAAAYAVFSNGGTYYEPYTVNKIIFRDTGEAIEYKSEGKKIISDSTAFMITDSLITAVQSGLSSGARMSGYNIAAKTGTTNYTEADAAAKGLPPDAVPDSWLIGYDSKISIGLWYGCENATKDKYLSAINSVINSGKLFRAVAKSVLTKGTKFKAPNSVVKVAVEKGSNPAKLASDSTPEKNITYEYFKKGTEPTEVSIKYSKLPNVTGLTANYNITDLSLTLNWNAAKPSTKVDEDEYGVLGYKIYKDNQLIKFTTDTTYTFLNVSEPSGIYKVVTTYKNYSDNQSSGATYKYAQTSIDTFDAKLKYTDSSYNVNDTLASFDQLPSSNDIMAYLNSVDVSEQSTTTVTITDPNGNSVTSIDASVIGTFTINYTVTYQGHVKNLSRTITINDIEQKEPSN